MIHRLVGYLLVPLLGLFLGIFIANHVTFAMSEETTIFIAVGLIMLLDLLAEGISHYLSDRFSFGSMSLTGIFNFVFAFFLLTLGYLLRVDLYIALFIVFGIKLFSNLSYISQKFFSKLQF